MRIPFLLLLGGLSVATVQAQTRISIGPRLGGNLATGTFLGVQVGIAASIGSGHWAVQPALVFTQKGLRQKVTINYSFGTLSAQENDQIDCRVHYLELPINVVYSLGQDGNGFQLFAGPYVAVGVGGQANYSLELTTNDPNYPGDSYNGSQQFAFGDTFVEPDPNSTNPVALDARARRFDAGINAGVGYRRGPVQVQLGYGLGLLNVQPDYPANYQSNPGGYQPSNDTGYLRTLQLTATYYFPTAGK
ncbi:MAG: PorT family protein [Hymenobacter sp.]|nr:MAG: PorT family protein [Hymenobacter sp.]